MVEGSAVAWFGALGLEVTGVEEASGEVVVGVQTPGGQVVLCASCGEGPLEGPPGGGIARRSGRRRSSGEGAVEKAGVGVPRPAVRCGVLD